MSKFKGTKGPWFFGNGSVYGNKLEGVCSMLGSTSRPIPLANARLIAAAPELLEALQGLVDYVDEMHRIGHIQRPNQSSIAMAAIVKALYEK